MSNLILWENTEEAKTLMGRAEQRFEMIYHELRLKDFTCTFIGSLRLGLDCEPEVWLNSNAPFEVYKRLTKNRAIELTLRHGSSGWWTLDALAEFVEGKGPIFEEAMCRNFRRGQRGRLETPSEKEWKRRFEYYYADKPTDERARLHELLLRPNESCRQGGITFDVHVLKNGLIAFYLIPVVGVTDATLMEAVAQFAYRGHIVRQQNGFEIYAENMKLEDKSDGVYVKRVSPDASFDELVFPSRILSGNLYAVLSNLIK